MTPLARPALLAVPAVVAGLLWIGGRQRPVAAFAFGPDGRPLVLAGSAGRLYVLATNVPLGPLVAWSADVRHDSRQQFDDARDELARRADRQVGDPIIPAPPGALSRLSTVAANRWGASAGYGSRPFGQPGTGYAYAWAPAWLVVALIGVAPVLTGRRWLRRRRRIRAGACLGCGYDLRHSPGRCPECGRARANVAP